MCQFTKIEEAQSLKVLYGICAAVLEFEKATSDYTETELAEGVCMELLIKDLRITIETGPEVIAEIETAKAIQKASHVN